MRKLHVPGSEDDEMHEFEKNTGDTGDHSPHLLEEEEEIKEDVKDEEKDTEEDIIVRDQITSRLTELLQVIPTFTFLYMHKPHSIYQVLKK